MRSGGAANVLPERAVELYDTVARQRDLDRGRRIWERIRALMGFLEAEAYTPRVKAACHLVGVTTGPLRASLLWPEDAELASLAHLLDAADLR